MRAELVDFLRCPVTGEALALAVDAERDGEIVAGSLRAASGRRYAVRDGIPRMVDEAQSLTDDASRQVQRSFGSKWQTWDDFVTSPAQRRFYDAHVARLLGCAVDDLRARLTESQVVLDAGCGTGWKLREYATEGQTWFGVDVSESVRPAYEQTRHMPRTHIIQGDLLHLPLRDELCDLIVSDGVIHHTADPAGAVRALSRALKPGGTLAVYVYAKKPPIREFVDRFLRERATALGFDECVKFCKPITQLGESLAKTGARITVPEDIPSLQIKAGEYDLQRFLYYHVMKCFYHPDFTFEENNLVNVDWYHPSYASTHTLDEVASWFASAGLSGVRTDVAESGIFAAGTKLPVGASTGGRTVPMEG